MMGAHFHEVYDHFYHFAERELRKIGSRLLPEIGNLLPVPNNQVF